MGGPSLRDTRNVGSAKSVPIDVCGSKSRAGQLEAITMLLFVRFQRFNFFGCPRSVFLQELFSGFELVSLVKRDQRRVVNPNHPLAKLLSKVVEALSVGSCLGR